MKIPEIHESHSERIEDAGDIIRALSLLVRSFKDRSAAYQLVCDVAQLVASNEILHGAAFSEMYSNLLELFWDARERRTEPGFWGSLFGKRKDENQAAREAIEEVTGFVEALEHLHQRRMNNSVLTRLALFAFALENADGQRDEELLQRMRAQMPPEIRHILNFAEGMQNVY